MTNNDRSNSLPTHPFQPTRTNRTKCDVCGRTAGVPTHKVSDRTCRNCGSANHTFCNR